MIRLACRCLILALAAITTACAVQPRMDYRLGLLAENPDPSRRLVGAERDMPPPYRP